MECPENRDQDIEEDGEVAGEGREDQDQVTEWNYHFRRVVDYKTCGE